jgi:hypothetical protein
MTIINRTHQFIFIHVPKTGGTSMKEHFHSYNGEYDVLVNRPSDLDEAGLNGISIRKHSSALQIRDAIGGAEYDRLFKFCVVRNPFIRTISIFRFLKFNFRSWPSAHVMEDLHSLEDFVTSPIFASAGPGGIINAQVAWITDGDGKNCVDYIARVESIDADVHEIYDRIGLPAPAKPLTRRNTSRGDAFPLVAELRGGAVVDAIRRRYAADFEFLHYDEDPENAPEFAETQNG